LCVFILKDREFVEINSNLLNNKLLQLKIQSSNETNENKLIDSLSNCLPCCVDLKLFKIINKNNKENVIYSKYS
jgi:hypothetical protein